MLVAALQESLVHGLNDATDQSLAEEYFIELQGEEATVNNPVCPGKSLLDIPCCFV